MKRKNPQTSLDAYNSIDPIKVSQTMQKISDALIAIKKGNYEMIAEQAGMPEQKTWKRLIDCVRAKLIHRTEETKLTKNGYKSYLFAPGPASEEVEKKKKVMKGPTVQQFSKAINQLHLNNQNIERLF